MIESTHMENALAKSGVYFLELSLENVRCFGEKTTIDLRDPKDKEKPARWTVIIGENGVGKTTVLRSLVSVAPLPTIVFNKFDAEPSHFQEWSGSWSLLRSKEDVSKVVAQFWNAENAIPQIQIQADRNYYSQIDRWNPWPFEHLKVLAYGASRHMGTNGIEEDPLKNASLSLFRENAELTNASELFHQTYITSTKEGNSRLHEKLKKIILAVLPDVSDIRAAKGPGFSWRAEVLTPYGWVWIHDLSLGYKTMVAWIVDFASKLFLLYPDAENPLAEAAVCLVDEIDLHMHPTWQRKIIGFLTETFPNTQFIVTAHSPLLVQAAGEANLVLLKREGDHVVVENDPIVVKNWSVDQILSSVYGMSPRLEETERQMEKKRELMTKSNRSLGEEQELMALEAKLEGYSIYKTAEEREAASLLDEFTQILKERKANPGHGQD